MIDLLFTWNGRITRCRYWEYIGIVIVIGICASIIGHYLPYNMSKILQATYNIIMLYPHYCISSKRLHDLNKPGWITLGLLVPYLNILLFIYIAFAKGQGGLNKYGQEPMYL